MTDLRAPLRYRKHRHEDSTFGWLLGLGLTLLALLAFEHYRSVQADKTERERQAAWDEQERQNARLQAEQFAEAQRLAQAQRQAANQRAFRSGQNWSGETDAQRNMREALEIMEDTRRIQREWDRQQYSRSAPDPVIVGPSSKLEPAQCGSLRSERKGIEASMRRGFQNGQHYRDRLNDIWKTMVSLGCDMRRS